MNAMAAEAAQTDPQQVVAELRGRLATCEAALAAKTAALDEVWAQQQASAAILQVINSSAGDLAPVFDAMLEKALRLCEASFGAFFTREGQFYRLGAHRGIPAPLMEVFPSQLRAGEAGGALAAIWRGKSLIHIADIMDTEDYRSGVWSRRLLADLGNARTALWIALRKDDELLGLFVLYRTDVRPFTDEQLALVQNFAAQAVIAMENARLLGELRQRTRDLQESLDYQTATSDVLQSISRAAFDLDAVLRTVVSSALRLCRGEYGVIFRNEGGEYRFAAGCGNRPEYEESERRAVIRPGRGTIIGRAALEGRAVQIGDALNDPEYEGRDDARINGHRAMLGVPLWREGQVIGAFGLARARVEPFNDKEVALVTTFADQAAIAIENARLLGELRESLEQQQAMAEVLGVINANPGDLQPVFDAMLDKALGLCGAAFGVLWTYDGERAHASALRGVSAEFAAFLTASPLRIGAENAHGRLLRGEPFIHIADVAKDVGYRSRDPTRRALVELGGGRTLLAVPLAKDGIFLGDFVIYRQEVRPFSDKQIVLLQNFAAQAVIAMENARLLDEIRQRQAELRVTFDNMGDGVAMFDADLRLAAWNRNFQTLLDLPDEFVAGRPSLAGCADYLAARGEYGSPELAADIARGREAPDRQNRFERSRPDGQVLEVRRDPVPGGGFVLMYADVTERKRAEAAIRDARDAAEKALAELSATQQQLVQQQKMAALGQLTAGIAHEIKNPLNFVNNFAGLSNELLAELKEAAAPALAALDDDRRADIDETIEMLSGNLDKIAEHGRRADGIVKSMLEHSRGGSGERRRVDLNSLIDDALNLAYHGARAQDQNFNITLERNLDPALAPIELAPQEITRVFLNLFSNGFYAASKKARTAASVFRPMLRVATRDVGFSVEIRVRDNGGGIAPEIRDKLFQPFVTTKPTGEGTGLGLSISYDIVTQQHGGTIEVASEVGEFTEFIVRLPRLADARLG
ncbi:MAG TPA: GAF domain-containing protein [Stellaceae bacterium]|nr:GAF domain-containing protein [Stellaceae bacterium]